MSKKIYLSLLLMAVLAPAVSLAAAPGSSRPINLSEIRDIIIIIRNFIVWVAGILMVAYFIWTGIVYMTAGDSKRVDKAKAMLRNGIWGVFIILGVYVIIYTIDFIVSRQFFR